MHAILHTCRVFTVGDLARDYGFHDIDDRQSAAFRMPKSEWPVRDLSSIELQKSPPYGTSFALVPGRPGDAWNETFTRLY
jgi:hypothetical protein